VFAAAPVVEGDVLNVGHPAAVVIAELPGVLEPWPAAVTFDLHDTWG
jgi:hypothetical protein